MLTLFEKKWLASELLKSVYLFMLWEIQYSHYSCHNRCM